MVVSRVVDPSSTVPPAPVAGAGASEVAVEFVVVGGAVGSAPLSPAQAETDSTRTAARTLRRTRNCIGLPIACYNTVRNNHPEEMITVHRSDNVHNSLSARAQVWQVPTSAKCTLSAMKPYRAVTLARTGASSSRGTSTEVPHSSQTRC